MRDRNFEWMRKRVFLRPQFMNSMITPAFDESESGSPKAFGEGEMFQNPISASKVDPTSLLQEVSNFGLVGMGKKTENDDHHFLWHMPFDVDPVYQLGVRMYSAVNETVSTEGKLRVIKVRIVKKNIAMVQAVDSWLIENVTGENGVALSNQRTPRSLFNIASLTRDNIEDGCMLVLNLETGFNVGTSAQADNTILGIEVDYVPQKCVGEGNTMERSLSTTGIE